MKNLKCPICKADLNCSQTDEKNYLYTCSVCMGHWEIVSTQKDKHRALIEDVEAKKKQFKIKRLPPKYKCPECSHICMEKEMEADADMDDESWSNWICPGCHYWHIDLKDWEEVIEDDSKPEENVREDLQS